MSRPTLAEINISALENNWRLMTELLGVELLIPVIKANAYGHGDAIVANQLQQWGAKRCAVAMVEEALKVREAGFKGEVLTLGPLTSDEIPLLSQLQCTPVIGDKQNLMDLAKAQFKNPIHIKWDTGMNRLGLKSEDVEWLKEFWQENPGLSITAFCTHFLQSMDYLKDQGYSARQLSAFEMIVEQFPQSQNMEKHIFNSDSFFANLEKRRTSTPFGARLGISLYGYSSIRNQWTQRLQPVMTLKTRVSHMTKVPKGHSVSYNASWVAPRDTVVAILPIGYADGYPRSLSNKGQVFIHGRRVPLVGIVCMDYLMIDITDLNKVRLGDEVELWGENLSLHFLAETSGTIVYELLASLTSRIPRKAIRSSP